MRMGTPIQGACFMVDLPFARKRSGGPRTAAGKAVVASNAISHGINARLVTFPNEDPAEFDALFQGLVADFGPHGTLEMNIVHRIAQLLWKQRRLDGYEQQQVSQAASLEVKIEDIFKKMNLGRPTDSVCNLFESLDEFTQDDLEKAETLLRECREFADSPKSFMNPVSGPVSFPTLWPKAMPQEWREHPNRLAALGLGGDKPDEQALQRITSEVASNRRDSWATILLITNREQIHQARKAVRAEKIMLAWDPERSHRYSAMLETQVYRALKELRSQQGWRLERMTIVPVEAMIGKQPS